jgi:Ran GTPase-activating protein (RanGAP) involved in mRNA processing and transport
MSTITSLTALSALPRSDAPLNVDLPRYPISHDDMASLCANLNGRTLSSLNLAGCTLDDECAEAIAVSLALKPIWPHLRLHVDLSDNGIQDRGAFALAEAIEYNPAISFALVNNKIGPQGGAALVKAVAKAGQEKCVDLRRNRLGDEGAKQIANSLEKNAGRIKYVYLHHNNIGIEGERALAQRVPKNIAISYRHRSVTIRDMVVRHPFITLFSAMVLGPLALPCIAVFPFVASYVISEDELDGLVTQSHNS